MEFNIDIVKGYYQPYTDPQYACYVMDHPGAFAGNLNRLFDVVDYPDGEMFMTQTAFFMAKHRDKVDHDVKINLNFVEESDIADTSEKACQIDVGYVYLRASVDDLKKAPYSGMIYLRLVAPRDKIVCLMINPRTIAYTVSTDVGEIVNRFRGIQQSGSSVVIRHLLSVPHPVDPGSVLTVPYFGPGALATATFHNTHGNPNFKMAGNIYVRKQEEVETCE